MFERPPIHLSPRQLNFGYPTRYVDDEPKRGIRGTLIESPAFTVRHESGLECDAVMIRDRADRQFTWSVLAAVPYNRSSAFLAGLKYHEWYGCRAGPDEGHVEVAIAHVDAGLDFPFRTAAYRANPREFRLIQLSQGWNIWLAILAGLRWNGFTADYCPYHWTR